MHKNHQIKYLGVLKYAESEKHIKRADNEYLKNWEKSFLKMSFRVKEMRKCYVKAVAAIGYF